MNVRQVNCVVYRQLDVIFLCRFVCNVICFYFITNYMSERIFESLHPLTVERVSLVKPAD